MKFSNGLSSLVDPAATDPLGAGLLRTGLLRAGLLGAGLLRAGLLRAGLCRAGIRRAGLLWAVFLRAGLLRAGRRRAALLRADLLAVGALAACVLAGLAPLSARATDLPAWEEVAGLQIVKDGAVDPLARIFDSPDYQRQLIVPSGGGEAYVLALKAQSVSLLSDEAITWTEEDLPVPDLAQGAELGLFLNDEGILSFDGDSASFVIQPEPPLVGPVTAEKLAQLKPDYVHAAGKFTPNAKAVEALRGVRTPTTIKVFFGTWCSYCKHWLPHLMKTVEVVGGKNLTIEYYGVSEDQSEPADILRKYDVSLTPSFVVVQNGQEVGRIEEEPLVSIEQDLATMLAGR